MITVVCKPDDPASKNMFNFIKNESGFDKALIIDNLNYSNKNSDLVIFLSKHESKNKIDCITCHAPGNFGNADFGGENNKLSVSNAIIQTECLRRMLIFKQRMNLSVDCCFEATHHGPSNNVPCLFVEIGSGPELWEQRELGSGIGSIVLSLIKDYDKLMKLKKKTIALGIGGTHYTTSFSKLVQKDENVCFGHICPKYQLNNLDKNMFVQMLDKTIPKPTLVVFDNSVNSAKRNEVIDWCNEFNLEVMKLK